MLPAFDLNKALSRLPFPPEAIVGLLVVIATVGGLIGGLTAPVEPGASNSSSNVGKIQVQDIPSRTDLTLEKRSDWYAHQVIEDGKAIRIFFNTGDPSCSGVRTEVKETPVSVSIALYQGVPPTAPEHCTLVATSASTVVKLSQPLGARIVTGRVAALG